MPPVRIEAPAKLNLNLKIGDRRPDGFHAIDSLFIALAWGDTLSVETVPGSHSPPLLEIFMDNYAIPPEENIIARAVDLFRSGTGYDRSLKITVQKRIPPGSGLGGGSSDAAAALLALSMLKGSGDGAIMEMGASLGSDVPFFLGSSPAAHASGRGEVLQPLDLPDSFKNLSFVLIKPDFSSNTAEAYRMLDMSRGAVVENLGMEVPFLDKSPKNWDFSNDFLPVFLADAKAGAIYRQIFTCLREQGAEFTGLSGSGSACFGVFSNGEEAQVAKKALSEQCSIAVVTFPLAHWAVPYYNVVEEDQRREGERHGDYRH